MTRDDKRQRDNVENLIIQVSHTFYWYYGKSVKNIIVKQHSCLLARLTIFNFNAVFYGAVNGDMARGKTLSFFNIERVATCQILKHGKILRAFNFPSH